MTFFSNFKSITLGDLRKLTDSEIHPLKQADLLFSEISRKRQLILETSQNFEKKTSIPNDCMFWIRTATNQVFQNEILLRNNKKNLALIRALGDFLPQKAETMDEFCELIHTELNHLSIQHQECRETLDRLKKESQKNLALQNKKIVAAENIKSIQGPTQPETSPISDLIIATNLGQSPLASQDGMAKLSIDLKARTTPTHLSVQLPVEAPQNPPENTVSLPFAHLEKAPPKLRPKVLAKIRLSPIQAQFIKKQPIVASSPLDRKPDEQALTEFAQFLSTVLKNS